MKLAQANVVHTSRVQQRQELHGARAMRCSSRHWHTAANNEVAVAASSATPSSHLESRVCAHFVPAVLTAAIPECGICDARLG